MERASTLSTKVVWFLLAAAFLFMVFRAATLSIRFDEADAFVRLVRPPLRDAVQQPDAAVHWLNVILTKRTVGLFRLSEFSFRLPNVLAGGLCLWGLYRLTKRTPLSGGYRLTRRTPLPQGDGLTKRTPLSGGYRPTKRTPLPQGDGLTKRTPLSWGYRLTKRTPVRLPLAVGVALLVFQPEYAISLALWVWALDFVIRYQTDRRENLNLAGLCLGLSVSASLIFAVPAVALIAAARRRASWIAVTERCFLTALATAFVILILPLSHGPLSPAHYAPHGGRRDFDGTKSLVQVLRREAAGRHVRIGVSPAVAPILDFYRARYRAGNWEFANSPTDNALDYYVLPPAELAGLAGPQLTVVYRDRDLVLAHSSRD